MSGVSSADGYSDAISIMGCNRYEVTEGPAVGQDQVSTVNSERVRLARLTQRRIGGMLLVSN